MSCSWVGVRQIALLAAMTIVVAGCSKAAPPSEPAKQPQQWPAMMSEVHFVWSAEPGIDLLTRPAVIVRAYQESLSAASFGGSNDYLYPGFDRAVDHNQPVGYPRSTLGLWPELNFPLKRPAVGTNGEHLLRVVRNGRNVTAVVCRWAWGVAQRHTNGLYESGTVGTGPATGLELTRLSLVAPDDPVADELSPQQGPSVFALTDVFGGWRVVGKLRATDSIGAGPEWPEFGQDLDACSARAPETVERRKLLTSGEHPRSDFPTLPAYPGWPVESQ